MRHDEETEPLEEILDVTRNVSFVQSSNQCTGTHQANQRTESARWAETKIVHYGQQMGGGNSCVPDPTDVIPLDHRHNAGRDLWVLPLPNRCTCAENWTLTISQLLQKM
jgi:hypothetical protein